VSTEIPTERAGRLIIEWPGTRFGDGVPYALMILRNADTGDAIVTATDLKVHIGVNTQYMAVAELTTLADRDGNPIIKNPPLHATTEYYDGDGNVLLATSWWHVAEMRVTP
jgi:hypothetical protein